MNWKRRLVMAWWVFLIAAWAFLSVRYFQRGDTVGGAIFLVTAVAVALFVFAGTKGYLRLSSHSPA